MGQQQRIIMNPGTGVPANTVYRLTQDFLHRHGSGLLNLLRRFPSVPGGSFKSAIERCLEPGVDRQALVTALEEACETLLSLRGEDFYPLPVDAGSRINVDAGLRWYAARLHDLAQAARRM